MDINTAQEQLHKSEMVGDEHLIVRRKLGIKNTVQARYESKIGIERKIENKTEIRERTDWNKSRFRNRTRRKQDQEQKDKLKHNRFEHNQAQGNRWPWKIRRGIAQSERISIEHRLSTVQTAQMALSLNQKTVEFVFCSCLVIVRCQRGL